MRSRASYRSPPATRIRSALPLLRLVVHQRPSLNSRWSTASYNLAQCPLWVKSGQTASRAKIRLGPLLSKSGQTRVRLKCLQSAINDHRSMSEGFSATAPPGVRPTLETAECGGQPRRSSIVVCRFGHSAALGGDGGFSASLFGAFQNCQATTQAQCHTAFVFGPASHRSLCQPS